MNLETEIRKASLSTICWVVLIVYHPRTIVGRLVLLGSALLLFIPFSLSVLGVSFTSLSAVGRSISTTLGAYCTRAQLSRAQLSSCADYMSRDCSAVPGSPSNHAQCAGTHVASVEFEAAMKQEPQL